MLTDTEVRAVYKTAPQNIKEYVDSDGVFNAFHEIRNKYSLHIDHAGNLATIINAVVLGIRPFTQMTALLKEALVGVDDTTRDKILTDINDKIFIPLRDLSKKHAEDVVAQKPTQPLLRKAEVALASASTPIVPAQTQTAATPATPTAPVVGVIEQKLSTTSAPPVTAQTVKPEPAPSAPVKYHGSDPYKEPIE